MTGTPYLWHTRQRPSTWCRRHQHQARTSDVEVELTLARLHPQVSCCFFHAKKRTLLPLLEIWGTLDSWLSSIRHSHFRYRFVIVVVLLLLVMSIDVFEDKWDDTVHYSAYVIYDDNVQLSRDWVIGTLLPEVETILQKPPMFIDNRNQLPGQEICDFKPTTSQVIATLRFN
ncbi:hypothetical protein LSH36_9g08005 [Paralvinella palmiformis]|uniref:Uncharacterized protein n=1 Tax=Paralvinella palmiformis TaxID=53620 RepID=A0AAD9KEB7_9ANNE|nr:hypothetical protein LSH36_9g08005 [Paralvinella palmiformis]